LFCDATYVKGRVRGLVVSRAVVVVTGVTSIGNREVLGCDVGDFRGGAFWTAFLRSLRQRGLKGVRLVVSDQHLGLKEAIGKVFVGASWQRCRVHFMRNALSRVQKQKAQMVAAAIKTIFAQPDRAHIHRQLDEVADTLRPGFPDVAKLLKDAKADLLAFSFFPMAHWTKIWSTNPLASIHRPTPVR
jgi:transposase-like protein